MAAASTVEEIFHQALAIAEGDARTAYLDRACAEEPQSRRRVEALLRAHTAAGRDFLESGRNGEERRTASSGDAIGRQLGPYRLLEVIGHGAQATVYRARHDELRREVALKVLRQSFIASSQAAVRFRREAELAAGLDHAGICAVHETGETDGTPWIAMQLVAGRTLASALTATQHDGAAARATALALPEVTATGDGDTAPVAGSKPSTGVSGASRTDVMRVVVLLEQAARALHAAHERGLVHRDIKPANLMVTPNGEPVVLDFGIARAGDHEDGPGLTATTDVLGTPHYMAPEQLRGAGRVDRRADVWALGVTLYECLTMRRPFEAPSRDALYRQILTDEPEAPRTHYPKIPRDLDVVVRTAIEKDRDRRYRTALDLADDLRRVRRHEPILARPVSPIGRLVRWAQRAPAVAASAAFAIVCLVAGLATSLWFLDDANRSLDLVLEARAEWYDDLSREAAAQDMRCETTLLQAQLQERALAMIEADVPDIRKRIAAARTAVVGSKTWSVDDPLALCLVLEDVLDELRLARGSCLSDWWHQQCRRLASEGSAEGALGKHRKALEHFAELSLIELDGVPVDDIRVLRARAFWLDVLLDANAFDDVAREVERFLASERTADIVPDETRRAIYRSRLGAALLGMGRTADAQPILESTVPRIVAEYPETWIALRAQANLVVLHEELGNASTATKLRHELCVGISRQTNGPHTMLSHWVPFSVRIGIGRHRPGLWQWYRELAIPTSVPESPSQARMPPDYPIAPDDPVRGLLYIVFGNLGGLGIENVTDLTTTTALLEAARDLVAEVPAARNSEYYANVLMLLGTAYMRAFRWDDAHACFNEALSLDCCRPGSPGWATVAAQRARLLTKSGQFERAEQQLGKCHPILPRWFGPNRGYARMAIAGLWQLYRAWGRFEDAERWLLRDIAQWDTRNIHGKHIETMLAFGRYRRAEELIEERKRVDPDWRKPYRNYALAALLRGDVDLARQRALRAKAIGNRLYTRVLARTTFALGDVATAVSEFEEAAAAGPGVIDGSGFWRDYALALAQTRDADAGIALLRTLIDRDPAKHLHWAALVDFLTTTDLDLNAAQRQLALTAATSASERSGGRIAHVQTLVAKALWLNGRRDEAEQTMTAVVDAMTGDAEWLTEAAAEALLARFRQR